MSITISDPETLAQLTAGDWVEVKDPTGKIVGRVQMERLGKLPPGVRSPLSDEEISARFKNPPVGRPLADILRDLEARG